MGIRNMIWSDWIEVRRVNDRISVINLMESI